MIIDPETDSGEKSGGAGRSMREGDPSVRLLIENSPVDLLLLEPDGQIVYSTCDLSGVAKEALIGRSIYQFVSRNCSGHLRKQLKQAGDNGRPGKIAARLKRRGSRPGLHLIRIKPVMASGRVTSFCLSLAELKRPDPLARKRARKMADPPAKDQVQAPPPQTVKYISLCSYCKSVKNETGEWDRIENFLMNRSADPKTEVKISHGICHQCMKQYFPHLRMNR